VTPAVYDLRAERVAVRPKVRMVGGRPFVRLPQAIEGVVLHQTAVRFGVSAAQLRAAGGDRALALARRGLGVACHAAAFMGAPDGSHPPLVVGAAPLRWHVNHGNGANASSLGLEVDGLYAGVEGDPRTVWGGKPPTPHHESTIDVARAALRWLVEEGRAEGMPIRYLWAHRQSSATRRSDPGEWLWREVAGWARDELGLEWQPERVWGDGRPLPAAWGVPGGARY